MKNRYVNTRLESAAKPLQHRYVATGVGSVWYLASAGVLSMAILPPPPLTPR